MPSRSNLSAAVLALVLAGVPASAEDAGVCGLFGTPGDESIATCAEGGIAPSAPEASDDGEFVTIAPASVEERSLVIPGEALLALPKNQTGEIPSNFELAPDARVVHSYFSPALCATIVRVSGPSGATPNELVTRVPETGTLVPHARLLPAGERSEEAAAPESGTSDDPYRIMQYGLDQLGAERAWQVSNGAGVTIAILDSAPQADHPDLSSLRVEAVPEGPSLDSAAHGTLMAGVIAAQPGNGIGISGVAPGAEVIAIPVCQAGPQGDECALYDVLRGIDRAVELGADVLNLSLVGASNVLLERAMARSERMGLLVVAAAGNEGTREPRYPAAYPSVIGVAATDSGGAVYRRSNTGLSADLMAPGVEVVSTTTGGRFALGDGTSLAAAHVSGVLALLRAAGASSIDVRNALAPPTTPRSTEALPPPLAPVCDLFLRIDKRCP